MEDEIEIEAIVIDAGSGTVKVVVLPKLLQFVRMCLCVTQHEGRGGALLLLTSFISPFNSNQAGFAGEDAPRSIFPSVVGTVDDQERFAQMNGHMATSTPSR